MAVICPNCLSSDTNALLDKHQCLSCGKPFVEGESPPTKTKKEK